MPMPPDEPMPLPATEFLRPPPLEAQDASYFAASARIRSFCTRVMVLNIHTVLFPVNDAKNLAGRPRRQTRRRYSVLKNRSALNADFRPHPLVSLDGIQPEWHLAREPVLHFIPLQVRLVRLKNLHPLLQGKGKACQLSLHGCR